MFKTLAFALFASTVLAFSDQAVAGQTAEGPQKGDESAIRKFLQEEIERWNTNGPLEPDRYTEDSDYVDVNGAWLKGFRARKNKSNSPRLKNSKIALIDLHIRFIRPDVAIVHQTHDMSGKRGPNGEELPTERQLSTRTLVKEGGKWVQTTFQNTIVRPVEPASN